MGLDFTTLNHLFFPVALYIILALQNTCLPNLSSMFTWERETKVTVRGIKTSFSVIKYVISQRFQGYCCESAVSLFKQRITWNDAYRPFNKE